MSEANQTPNLAVMIMAGGAGTRFWPVSTEKRPKQFLSLVGARSMLQQSYDRVASLVPPERVLVMTNARFVGMVREQLPELPAGNVIGEPMRRDTGAAVALAALLVRKRFGNPVMAVLTADHHIEPIARFQQILLSAARAAAANPSVLYTFGIKPTFAATGYGYLLRGENLPTDGDVAHSRLEAFAEKPDLATAQKYVDAGEYWNSGMFVYTVDAIVSELEKHLPVHLEHLAAAAAHDGTAEWDDALRAAFEPLSSISIDFAVMEKAADVRCVAADFNWSDVGGRLALRDYLDETGGNHHRGHVHVEDARGNLVFCDDANEHVALVGVEGVVVVRSENRTLVVHRDRTEDIKKLVKGLDDALK